MNRNEIIQTAPSSAKRGWRPRAAHLGLSAALGLALALSVLLLAGAAPDPAQPRLGQTANTGAAQAALQARRWLSETVDASNYYIGSYNSLALEPTAPFTPHISYLDWTNSNLKHAWWTPSGWLSETVDSSGAVGWNTSLTLEPTAPYTPHISYYDGGNQNLKHAWWTPSGWLSETVDNSANVGVYTSLALEPAAPYTPRISYEDRTNYALKHAWWTPSGWMSETVDSREVVGRYTSLALEPTALFTPHISYWALLPNTALMHAWWTPSGWISETVDSGFDLGRHTSLALAPTPPYTPHISYYDGGNQNLKHAWWTPSGWLSETVNSSGAVADSDTYLALEPTAPFVPHISYIANGSLMHAWWTPSGWMSETVDSGSGYPSLALEPVAPYAAHISYRDNTNDALKHAWLVIPRRVLFDEAHEEENTLSWERAQQIEPGHPEWVYFGQLSSTLASEFTLERNPDGPLTTQLLQDYDALILAAPQAEFTSGEIAAIRQYVNTGGGLIVLGECGLDHPANAFLPDYEISFDPHCIWAPIPVFGGDFPVTNFASHPAVAGVSSFTTNWGQSLLFGSGATYLAWTGTDSWQDTDWSNTYNTGDLTGPFTIVAGYDTGYGRVAVVSDNGFQDDGFEGRGNATLMRALLRWVTGGQKRELSFAYLPLVLREYQ